MENMSASDNVVGMDGDGKEVRTDELWQAAKDGDGTHKSWYSSAVKYWDQQAATYDGVLGGFGCVSDVDIRDSSALLNKAFRLHFQEQSPAQLVAIDTGTGVGRVTKELLLHHFGTVDLLEPSAHLLAAAKQSLELAGPPEFPPGHTIGHLYQQGLETWSPEAGRYDCIWVQWCLLYLTDDDFVAFFLRAAQGLRPRGLLVVKENTCKSGFVVDRDDSSLTRSNAYYLGLFARANVSVLYNVKQKGMPKELYDVRMYVLQPRESAL